VSVAYLVAIGKVPPQVLDWVENTLVEWSPWPVRRLPSMAFPEDAYDASRGQYKSVELMKLLARSAPADAARMIGVTEGDLAIPTLTFVFGQAQLDGPVAVVSLARLRQEFYDLPVDEAALHERVTKEVLHELGHTFGLTHCAQAKCVMSLATHIGLVDNKDERFCAQCGEQVAKKISSPDREAL
jgi:archaemetzincin